jgi:hypothetical protein
MSEPVVPSGRQTVMSLSGKSRTLARSALLLASALAMLTVAPPSPASASAEMVVLLGNGTEGAHFGQAEAAAIDGLDKLLGPPKRSVPISEAGNCTIDAAMQWPALTAYFDHGRFVGYSTISAAGNALPRANLVTAKGLRVGATLAEARRTYGSALRTSYAQGGSWSAKTASGALDGYLSAEVGQRRPPPRILSIEAGAVGCPASSP